MSTFYEAIISSIKKKMKEREKERKEGKKEEERERDGFPRLRVAPWWNPAHPTWRRPPIRISLGMGGVASTNTFFQLPHWSLLVTQLTCRATLRAVGPGPRRGQASRQTEDDDGGRGEALGLQKG